MRKDGPTSDSTAIRVLVIDDSIVIRKAIREMLSAHSIQVDVAPHGRIGLDRLRLRQVQLVILDLDMPVMDGHETLSKIREFEPKLPVIVFSVLTERGAQDTLEALARGATAYVTKPSTLRKSGTTKEQLESELLPLVLELAGPTESTPASAPQPKSIDPASIPAPSQRPIEILAIGASTGGPRAVEDVLMGLPAPFDLPIVIVIHMPPLFTEIYARRLASKIKRTVVEVTQPIELERGVIYLAAGDFHMQLERQGTKIVCVPTSDPPQNGCRPAVDVLFQSVAQVFQSGALAVVLTGMGKDGLQGAHLLKQCRSRVFAQDRASSTVWSMPGAVAQAGLADKVCNLSEMSQAIYTVSQGKTRSEK